MEKLLIIDDDREILQCFFYAFPEHQYEVHSAETASAALELFRQQAFDVVIADIRLPDCSGLELLEQLHQQDARVPVILMTGAGSSNTAIEAIRRGAYHYIVKPFDLDELQLVVSRALQASRMMRTQVLLNLDEDKSTDSCDLLVGKCAAMQAGRDRADSWRKRYGKGSGCPSDLSVQQTGEPSVPGDQLRCDSRVTAGKRTFRPREGVLHGGRSHADRQVRAM